MWKSRLSKHARLLVLVISVVGVTILTSLIRYLVRVLAAANRCKLCKVKYQQ